MSDPAVVQLIGSMAQVLRGLEVAIASFEVSLKASDQSRASVDALAMLLREKRLISRRDVARYHDLVAEALAEQAVDEALAPERSAREVIRACAGEIADYRRQLEADLAAAAPIPAEG